MPCSHSPSEQEVKIFPDRKRIEDEFNFCFDKIVASIVSDFSLCVTGRNIVSKFQILFHSIRISISLNYHPDFPGQICFKACQFIHFFMVPVFAYPIS